jgi:hypothetical protein
MELQFENEEYYLVDENNDTIATTDKVLLKEYNGYMKKLSKQNCDELFGVIDVDKLAKNYEKENFNGDLENHPLQIFKDGFNKAMELYKDKLFTKGDMAYIMNIMSIHDIPFEDAIVKFQSLQQPTEIEVEIEMEYQGFEVDGGIREAYLPKLDENNCLILKKK